MPRKSKPGKNPFPHLVKQKCREQKATKRRRVKALKDAARMQRKDWL